MKYINGDTEGDRKHRELIAQWVTGLEESLAYHEGVTLDRVSTSRKGVTWQLVVAGRRGGKHIVAFFTCCDIHECYIALAAAVKHHKVDWRPDRFANNTTK